MIVEHDPARLPRAAHKAQRGGAGNVAKPHRKANGEFSEAFHDIRIEI